MKRLTETVRDEGEILSIVLAGHPKLKADLRRPHLEEIGARTEVFTLDGIQGQQGAYIDWLLAQCIKSKGKADTVLSDEALELLADRLATPLQIAHYYLARALEEAYQIGRQRESSHRRASEYLE